MIHSAAFNPLSKNDAAEILGVTIRTIENHISAGLLPVEMWITLAAIPLIVLLRAPATQAAAKQLPAAID